MPDLITLEEAKAHLRITSTTEDGDITDKLTAATQVVIDYLTRRDATWNAEMAAWTAATIPKSVRAAILVQFGELYQKRGDELSIDPQAPIMLSRTVMSLLMRYREPGVA